MGINTDGDEKGGNEEMTVSACNNWCQDHAVHDHTPLPLGLSLTHPHLPLGLSLTHTRTRW